LNTPKHLRICARSSPLSLAQVEEVRPLLIRLLGECVIEVVAAETIGDRDQTTPLDAAGVPDDFFTRELDAMVLEGRAELSIHSAKDLPRTPVPGLHVAAFLPAADIRDALVFATGFSEENPPQRIGTSSPARRALVPTLFPRAEAIPIRGTIQNRLAQLDAGNYDAVIIAACALERLQLSDRIGMYLPCDPAPNQGRLALVVREDNTLLRNLLGRIDVRRTAGLVAMVGCPADFELICARALTYIEHADVVLHDRLIPPDALKIIGNRGVEVGKTGGDDSTSQHDIHRHILHASEAGKLVVRLHGGEPAILGKLGETLAFCQDWGLRTDVVCAVSAAQIAAARARTTLTHRHGGRSVRFITGHAPDEYNPEHYSGPEQGNLAIYMGVRNRNRVYERLREKGWPDAAPLIVGQSIGYPNERLHTLTLKDLPTADIRSPSVMLLGETAWPGEGYTLFTGSDPLPFLRYGPLLHWPQIRLEALPVEQRVLALQQVFPECDGVVFPSRFAVTCFMEALLEFADARALHGKRVLAVGPQTAEELRRVGLRADAAPKGFGGVAALAREMGEAARGRWFYPCSDLAPTADRAAALAHTGAELRPAQFYTTVESASSELPGLPFSRVLFTSGSTARSYFKNHPEEFTTARSWIAVGHSTLAVLDELGVNGELLHDET